MKLTRKPLEMRELLLVVAWLLEQQPMSEEEVLAELDQRFGLCYRFSAGRALIALAALEAEGLVDASGVANTVYELTAAGAEAVGRRVRQVVPECDQAGEARTEAQVECAAILFTDIVGSTELLDRVGDEAAHGIRRRHFGLLRRAVRENSGREIKSLGDGLMVVFDGAPQAVSCALRMQHAVMSCEDPLHLRIGVAWGETVSEDDDYFGRPVIVARRLCDSAGGGEVIVPEELCRNLAVQSGVDLAPLGSLELKGLSHPICANVLRVPSLPSPVGVA